jgi:ribosomal-protein-alanine N-acetyltransferase
VIAAVSPPDVTSSHGAEFAFSPMTPEAAGEVLHWSYAEPYDLYNEDPESAETTVRALLNPAYRYRTMRTGPGELVAYCCFGADARVLGGDYTSEALDIGLGVRPDLTGRGQGHRFVRAVLQYASTELPSAAYRVTIAEFNRRARRVWERAGFVERQRFRRLSDGLAFVVLVRQDEDTCEAAHSRYAPGTG